MKTLALWILGVSFGACQSTPLLESTDPLDAARTYLDMGRYGEAADLARPVAASTAASLEERAEAAFLAAEAEVGEGQHLKAFRHYVYILENAPWSEHARVIEDRLFDIGLAFFHDEKYEGWIFSSRSRGVEVFETLQAYYRRSDRADDALRHVADFFVEDEAWAEAAFTYEELLAEYPASEWAERSLWRAGWCRMQMSRGPEYDRDELLRAKQQLDRSLRLHPKGVAAADSRRDLAEVRQRLARCEIVVADFYRARGVSTGERLRLANAFLLYPETEAGAAASDRLIALGVDLDELRADRALASIDAIRPGRPLWEGEGRER